MWKQEKHKLRIFMCFPKKAGAAEGTRTPDPIITNDVLYQLSYTGTLLCAGLLAPPIRSV